MTDTTDDKGMRKWGLFALLAGVVIVADQLSKWWAVAHLTPCICGPDGAWLL